MCCITNVFVAYYERLGKIFKYHLNIAKNQEKTAYKYHILIFCNILALLPYQRVTISINEMLFSL